VIEIGGYVERTADAAADMQVSQQRADAVRNALVDGGVDPARVVAKGHGAVDPASGGSALRMIDYKVGKS
jgi:OmpA-OmpF porin, OOP family